jgi:hypothetical protein
MPPPIRELKRSYKLNLAQGHLLPTFDLAVPLPLSTGNPLFDAALLDRFVATATMSEAEHLARGRQLAAAATDAELETLARHAPALQNDYKLLLALECWSRGRPELVRRFLRALPWAWRLAFPTAVVKPAARLFTGWRRSLRSRLVSDPRFPELRELYRNLLAEAPPVAILKYRAAIQEAAALLKYRFEGERERAIHDWCFGSGDAAREAAELEPLPTYLRARAALASGGLTDFTSVLQGSPATIPITSFMGLLGNAGVQLSGGGSETRGLRRYAVRCATPVESLLLLKEWAPWLTQALADQIGQKVRASSVESGFDIPFFKVVKAFRSAPRSAQEGLLQPLLLPMLREFGRQVAQLFPGPGPITFVQPGNVIHGMSFLLYAAVASGADTRLLLLFKDGVEEVGPLDPEAVAAHLADERPNFEAWLLEVFGGLSSQHEYTYHFPRLAETIATLDPAAPLVLNLPFTSEPDLLMALLPFEQVFNLNGPCGAPGELSLAPRYYSKVGGAFRYGQAGSQFADAATLRFTELVDRVRQIQALAAGTESSQ